MKSIAWLFPWSLSIIELALILGVAPVLLRRKRSRPLRFPLWFQRLASRPRAAFVAIGLTVLLLRVALIPVLSIPQPGAHDEFSYLLAADTFAHGRLTNPTPPLWQHFETFHIILHPTYQSMYAPGQGLLLAFGQLLGHPWIGQLLITSLLCSVFHWMLRAWFPPLWALTGACLAALRFGILGYWMNTYWSGSIVALSGALVLGAWPRVRQRPNSRDALLMGFGLVLLANTRPYEGFVYSLPFAAAMLLWLRSPRRHSWTAILSRALVPLAAVLLVGAIATGLYYRKLTGSAVLPAYEVNRVAYKTAPYFLWSSPQHLDYRHAEMRDFYLLDLKSYYEMRTLPGYFGHAASKFGQSWRYYLGPLLTIPLLAALWHGRDRRIRFPLMLAVTGIVALAPETWALPHYYAPATGALLILITQGLRYLAHTRLHGQVVGGAIVRNVFGIALAMVLFRLAAVPAHLPIEYRWPRGNLDRARISRQLEALPGSHIVIVQYSRDHDVNNDWVYNSADLAASRVIWARDMGPQNQELFDYFPNRRLWTVSADDAYPQAMPLR